MPKELTGVGSEIKRAPAHTVRAVVVGGGVVGLSIARELAGDGWKVTVFDRGEPGGEASSAAAGMLVPALEFHDLPELRSFGEASRALYPAYIEELEDETGTHTDLRLEGALALFDENKFGGEIPEHGEVLEHEESRRLEPALSRDAGRAIYFPRDGSIDNRALVQAILQSCRMRGVSIETGRAVDEIMGRAGRVVGIRCGDREHPADVVVNCGGAWASRIRSPVTIERVRPIMGQMLLLDRQLPNRRLGPEKLIYSHTAYLVPRSDGRLVLGTTVEDRGYEKVVEAGAVARLLRNAIRLCPGLEKARWIEAWAGLRPLGAARTPTIGTTELSGYCVAIGHYRNGILLAPLTARAVADGLAGRTSRWSPYFRR